jgi:GGDEF domain-containing protein
MTTGRLRPVLSWMIPGGLVVLSAVLVLRLVDVSSIAIVTRGSLYAVQVAAVLLAWRFRRSRVVAATAAVAIVDQLLSRATGPDAEAVYAAAALLLPVTIGLLSSIRDRGLLSLRGGVQLFAVLIQPLVVSLLLEFVPGTAWRVFTYQLLDAGLTAWTSVPQPALLGYLAAFTLTLVVAVRRGSPVEKGLLWTLVATFLALDAGAGSGSSRVFFLAAALTLGLSVVEFSYSIGYRDELTGLPARRALREALAGLGSRYSIAVVDVDHFKKVNDRHGHDVGDQVLRMVAARVKRVSGGGRAFRYGGEEFAVVFPGKSRDEAVPHLEKLRAKVDEYGFTLRGWGRPRKRPHKPRARRKRGGRRLAVTVSIGVADRDEKNSSTEKVLKAADRALYRAKRGGRNRVC